MHKKVRAPKSGSYALQFGGELIRAIYRARGTYEAAKAKGEDGRPDFLARKECNYLVSVLQVMQ